MFKTYTLRAYLSNARDVDTIVKSKQLLQPRGSQIDPSFIIDSGATVTIAKSACNIRAESYAEVKDPKLFEVGGIVGAASLDITGVGLLHAPFDEIRALHAPDAAENILSWFDIKIRYWIELIDQDQTSEHLLLTHKTRPGVELKCPLDPIVGMYVYDFNKARAEALTQFDPFKQRVYTLQTLRSLQAKDVPKTLAVQVNRLQEVHECLCHVGSDAMLKLIQQKRLDRAFNNEVHKIWAEHVLPYCTGCPAGKSHSPDAIATMSLPPATIGDALQADIVYLTSNRER